MENDFVLLVCVTVGKLKYFCKIDFVLNFRLLHRRTDLKDESTLKEGIKLLQDLVASETFSILQELSDKRRANAGEKMTLFCCTGKETAKLLGLLADHKVILPKTGEYGFDVSVFNSSMMSTYKLWRTSNKFFAEIVFSKKVKY